MNTREKIEAALALPWGFMTPEIVMSNEVASVDTTDGTVYLDIHNLGLPSVPPTGDDDAVMAWLSEVDDYLPGRCVDPEGIATMRGYMCRVSAPGYMDATDWQYCETEADVLAWLEDEADNAGLEGE